MERGGCTYFMSNRHNTVIYTGVTSDLIGRVWQHKNKTDPKSFTARYNCDKLVWYECFYSIEEAILREKQLKNWRREKKVKLIESMKPEWRDLYPDILEDL